MNRLFLLTILIFNILFVSGQEPLPRGMTEAERMIWDDYLKNYPADRELLRQAKFPHLRMGRSTRCNHYVGFI